MTLKVIYLDGTVAYLSLPQIIIFIEDTGYKLHSIMTWGT